MICRIISNYRIIEKLGSSKPVSGNTNKIIPIHLTPRQISYLQFPNLNLLR